LLTRPVVLIALSNYLTTLARQLCPPPIPTMVLMFLRP